MTKLTEHLAKLSPSGKAESTQRSEEVKLRKHLGKNSNSDSAGSDQLPYPEDSAGLLMSGNFVRLAPEMTIGEAFKTLRSSTKPLKAIYSCFVTDKEDKLIGVISVRDIFAAQDDQLVSEVMEDAVVSVLAEDDQEDVAVAFDRYDFLALPVTDEAGRLLGVITVDDAMDIMREEAREDLTKMAAVTPAERPYLETSTWQHAKSRVFWLLLLTLSGLINEVILSHYEQAFLALPVLVSFIPMLTDTGGNAGAQSSAVIIRSLAMGEISIKDFFWVVWKEIRIGFVVGVTMAAVNLVRVYFLEKERFILALTVSLTLICIAMVAKALGAALPILAEKFKLDPAVMAGPVIATVADGIAILIYFSLASLIVL